YGPNCIYSLKDPHGGRAHRQLYRAGVNFTIQTEYSYRTKNKTDGDCYSINSSLIKPERLFMSYFNNTDGPYCCGLQVRKCKNNRNQNSTTNFEESGEQFVMRVLRSCSNMTGYVSRVMCNRYGTKNDTVVEIRLQSKPKNRLFVYYDCDPKAALVTSWGHKLDIRPWVKMTVDVWNQTLTRRFNKRRKFAK
ncbi:hypothetical protein HZS_2552, partial [Henneguya salminicola]